MNCSPATPTPVPRDRHAEVARVLADLREAAPSIESIEKAMRAIIRAVFAHRPHDAQEAAQKVGRLVTEVCAAADLAARYTWWADVKRPRPEVFAIEKSAYAFGALEFGLSGAQRKMLGIKNVNVPRVIPEAAIQELLERVPMLRLGAAEVRRAYAEEHAFALALSTSDVITKHVQNEISGALMDGKSLRDVETFVAAHGQWTRDYAENVVRTNVTTAFSSGRFREAERAADLGLVQGMQFASVGDSDTRPNHQKANGLIAGVHDPVWNKLSPPLGYRCRCTVFPVDESEIPPELLLPDGTLRPAVIPDGAGPDLPEFGRRPDTRTFLAA